MQNWIVHLDRILRGEATRPADLERGTIEMPLLGIGLVIVLLALVYGLCMGCYAIFRVEGASYVQFLATSVKVPALFLLTLVVTFPSLYVFNALVGSRLGFVDVLRLLIASLAVNLAVLASLGPITAFFSVSTASYPFMVLLNVVVFGVSGLLGLTFLLQTLNRLTLAQQGPPVRPPLPSPPGELVPAQVVDEPSALERPEGHVLGRHVKKVFGIWVVLFALVGAQMSWVLRPFLGDPNLKFQWFRPRQSNFFESVLQTIISFFT